MPENEHEFIQLVCPRCGALLQQTEGDILSCVYCGAKLYYDPNTGQNVELPSGYTQAWSTPLGEYILSDDPNFNPNIGSNQTWTPLAPPQQ
jgi:hypothetical protein